MIRCFRSNTEVLNSLPVSVVLYQKGETGEYTELCTLSVGQSYNLPLPLLYDSHSSSGIFIQPLTDRSASTIMYYLRVLFRFFGSKVPGSSGKPKNKVVQLEKAPPAVPAASCHNVRLSLAVF